VEAVLLIHKESVFMPDLLNAAAATSGGSVSVENLNLTIHEVESRFLWSVQASQKHSLSDFALAMFGTDLEDAAMRNRESLRLIHLWPHKAFVLSDQATLPTSADSFASLITDISHGFCELSLRGQAALQFVNSYCTADLIAGQASSQGNVRCRFGQYHVVVWWNDRSDMRLILDRSYAQSFRDYIVHLMQRWQEL
jgi:sarcosine oxidase gamma subunit